MDKKNTRIGAPMVGGGSLLVIFAVLCLTVFSLLGLSTVQADQRLSDISAQAVTAYYAADGQAEMIFAQLRRGELPKEVKLVDGEYRYTCTVSDTSELQVAVTQTEDGWKVLRWQTVSTADLKVDENLSVWDGET